MTMDELETAVWEARATVGLTARDTPTIRGTLPLAVRDAIQGEHCTEVVHRLKGFGGARLEGLVCERCCPEAVTGEPPHYRSCPEHGLQLHYPRVS